MDKLMQIRVLIRLAERASFSAVARDLKVTQSAISKAITALEQSLGAQLVSRSTRSVVLTEAGRGYYERCRLIVADIDEADAAVADLNVLSMGSLNITAPVPFGLMFVSSRVARFKILNPAIEINLNLSDQSLNLVEESLDVAIRLGHLKMQGFAARKLGESPVVTVASPEYLYSRGVLETPRDVNAHNCVVYSNQDNPLEWKFEKSAASRSIIVKSNYRSNNLLAVKDAALAGVGLARLPLWMADAEIKAGLLKPVLINFRPPSFDIHAVFPTGRQIPAKVKLFVEFIKSELNSVSYF